MPLDWFGRSGASESVAELVSKKKYVKALEKLRDEFRGGNRSVGLRLQYADVLEQSNQIDQAIPVLLGLASELFAAGAHARAHEVLQDAERLGPGREDVAAKRRAITVEPAPTQEVETAATLPGAPVAEEFSEDLSDTAEEEVAVSPAPPAVPGPPLDALAEAIDIFGPALAPPSLSAPQPTSEPVGEAAIVDEVEAAPAVPGEVREAAEVWVEPEGEAAPEVLVAEVVSEPSVADIAEMAVADGQSSKGSLVTYIRELASRFPLPDHERPGPGHLAAALFAGLEDAELRKHLSGLSRRDFDPGAAMIREGEPVLGLFILARGRARVRMAAAHGGSFEVAELSEGTFFGEVSLVGGRRTATVEALGPCETLEVGSAVIEGLAAARPLVQQILEDAVLERAGGPEVEAVRAVPAMDPETPARALALLDAHFGLPSWNPKARLRLAEVLARSGSYLDVVPVLVGVADEMQGAGQPARALAVLGKLAALGVRASREVSLPPLHRDPKTPRAAAPATVLVYVAQGQPAPPPRASEQLRRWLQQLMGEARVEAGEETEARDDADLDLLAALENDAGR